MFVEAFQNDLRGGHFNEILAQKLVVSMTEIMARVECNIKREERNDEKKTKYVKECASEGSYSS